MATVTLSAGFDTENLWATRVGDALTRTSTTYEFQSDFGFVRVTGTGFTYHAQIPQIVTGGQYTSILVATDASFSTPIATYSSVSGANLAFFFTNGSTDAFPGADTINGSSGADTINGRGGADTLDGKLGGDTYVFNASEIDSGLSINDTGGSGNGTDTIRLGVGTDFDFVDIGGILISGIEALTFSNAQTASFSSDQLPGNLTPAALAVTGVNGSLQTLIVEVAQDFSAELWTFTTWEATDVVKINGTANIDTIVGSSKNDVIAGKGGGDSLDGKEGGDTYVVDDTDVLAGLTISDTGNTGIDTLQLGAGTSFSFAGVPAFVGIEALTFTGVQSATFDAAAFSTSLVVNGAGNSFSQQTLTILNASDFSAAVWTFNAWTNNLVRILGTASADTIVGSSQTDNISAGGGADTLDGKGGSDVYFLSGNVTGASITDTGASGTDRIYLGTSVDLTVATISGFEDLTLDGAITGTVNAAQLPANLIVRVLGAGIHTVAVQNAQQFSAAGWTFTNAPATAVTIAGTAAADSITASIANDTVDGNAGNDILQGGLGDDSLDGGADNDTASYRDSALGVTVSLAIVGAQDTIGAGTDSLNLIENLIGSLTGADHLTGDGNANVLTGLGGKDTLIGGLGLDTFDFNLKSESVKGANRDVIEDFSGLRVLGGDLDRIDLSGIDAKKGAGNQTFHFIGAHKFHHKAGELQVKYNATTDTAIVSGDIDGNGRADFQIAVHSTAVLAKGDFVL